jgi:uncharacterized membrane protein YcaP (DUF421 family)
VEIVVRASFVFLFLLLLTRGMKRRTLADMAPFEMLLLVILGDIVQQGVTQEDMSLTGSVLAVSTFAFWITVLSWLTWRWRRVGRIVDGVPVVLVRDGKPVDAVLAVERMPLDELHEAARQEGIDDLAKVKVAVLEPSGRISFIKVDA